MIRAGFGLQDDGVWYERKRGVPCAGRNIDAKRAIRCITRRVISADFLSKIMLNSTNNATPLPATNQGQATSSACCCTSQTPTAKASTNTRIKKPAAGQHNSA